MSNYITIINFPNLFTPDRSDNPSADKALQVKFRVDGDTGPVSKAKCRFTSNQTSIQVFDANKKRVDTIHSGSATFELTSAQDGIVTFYIWSHDKIILKPSLTVEGSTFFTPPQGMPNYVTFTDDTDEDDEFSPIEYPSDDDGNLSFGDNSDHITLHIPDDLRLNMMGKEGALVTLLVNGGNAQTQQPEKAYTTGFRVPIDWLNTVAGEENFFALTMFAGNTASALVPTRAVMGTPDDNTPGVGIHRWMERAQLPWDGTIINNARDDLVITIPAPQDAYAIPLWKDGNYVELYLYLNGFDGFYHDPKSDKISIKGRVLVAGQLGDPYKITVPKTNIQGYGMDDHGHAGTFAIDYMLRDPNGKGLAQPREINIGDLNTVGPAAS
ncbi:hypothetical protein ACFSE0_11725 [Ochrobactrum teleogrylli]|uniref:IgGFc-binding protein N-terminal domain-containing protein n=1 Tax=Ochrobactrum teleogrylli TaxID=2479765 RepID=A0ABY2Y1S2_9HYPH|nr:hypothetical protein [[Ochrobactrum] teleogrylli]TNV10826.1 hypothetical protein FIC94_19590 [[Ochrobactrum] teleogrylli]